LPRILVGPDGEIHVGQAETVFTQSCRAKLSKEVLYFPTRSKGTTAKPSETSVYINFYNKTHVSNLNALPCRQALSVTSIGELPALMLKVDNGHCVGMNQIGIAQEIGVHAVQIKVQPVVVLEVTILILSH
jgi:hypothetical protein